MNDFTVGDIMSEGNNKALKSLAIFAGMLVYLGMIIYSGVHNWHLMTSGIPPSMVIWAAMGVISLEISAVFLPIAIHWWTHAPMQRIAAFAFYAVDLALIFSNVVLDYAIVNGATEIPAWLLAYRFYGVPATPVIAGLGWTVLFLLDPSARRRATIEALRASTHEALAVRIAQAAKAADIGEAVDISAQNLARDIVAQTLGPATQRRKLPAKTNEPEPGGNGRHPIRIYSAEITSPNASQVEEK